MPFLDGNLTMDAIILSFRQVLRLANALYIAPSVFIVTPHRIRVKIIFHPRYLELSSVPVSISYAKKWYPIIMGEHLYRNSILYSL